MDIILEKYRGKCGVCERESVREREREREREERDRQRDWGRDWGGAGREG